MVLLLNLLLLGLLSGGLYRHWRHSPASLYYWPGLLLKLLCGAAMVALYQHHYGGGDVLMFHRAASALASLFFEDANAYASELTNMGILQGSSPWRGIDRTEFYIKILSLLYLLCGDNIWMASLWLSFAAFAASFWLVHRLSLQFSGSMGAAAVAFLFWPSVVFWTSSLLKESAAMAATAIVVAVFLPAIRGKGSNRLWQWAVMIVAAWFLWRLKYYFAIPLYGMLLLLALAAYLKRSGLSLRKMTLGLGLGFVLLLLLLSQLHPNLRSFDRIFYVLVYNYHALVALSEAGNHLYFEGIQPSLWSILYYSPKALAGGLLMPLPFLPFQPKLIFLLAGFENLLLLLLLIAAFYKLYKRPPFAVSWPALGLVVYVCLMAIAMAIASPNFGTLLRYRTAYLPFAVFLLLYWLYPKAGEEGRALDSFSF